MCGAGYVGIARILRSPASHPTPTAPGLDRVIYELPNRVRLPLPAKAVYPTLDKESCEKPIAKEELRSLQQDVSTSTV